MTVSTEPSSSHHPPRPYWPVVIVVLLTLGIAAAAVWPRYFGPMARYQRGRDALISGDRVAVEHISESLIHTAGYEAHGWLLRGLLLMRSGKLQEATGCLGNAVEDESLAVEANYTAAQCFYRAGMYPQTVQAAQLALERDPDCLEARRWLASAYYDLGNLTHATVELARISAAAPDDPRPDRLLGLIAKDSEQFAKAIEYYRESLRRAPNQPEADAIRTEMAESHLKLGQFAEALAALRPCPRSAAVLTLEAECFNSTGDVEQSQARLRAALAVDPKYFPAKLMQGKVLLDEGKSDEAEKVLKEAVQLEPQNSQAHFQLSQALRRSEKITEADEELQKMQSIQAIHREFSDLHEDADARPGDVEVRYRIGDLAQKLGKPKLAILWYRAALSIDPNHAKSRAALQELSAAR
ncbi:MAG: tetratricopeptide repeat protein [Planctomycetes bacterium]|nr:tetratricopeptide repeat protein [Planctomycetota bacterium]